MTEQVDVVVVGLGVGGEEVAGRLAESGLRVVGVESRLVGGECPYFACVPTKMMVRAAGMLAEARRMPTLAGTADVRPDWSLVARRIRDEATDDWDDTVAVDRFTGKGGRFVRGRARLVGPRRVEVNGEEYDASRGVVLATGTEPAVPPIPGLKDSGFWTNREAVAATEVPESLIVLGGGAVGLEMAQVFARFGAKVTIVEALDRLLANEEPEASALAADVLRRDGLDVRVGAKAEEIRAADGTFTVRLGGDDEVSAARLLVATGRRPNLADLGLDAVGLDPTARAVEVDAHLRAGDGLWAIGDITGKGAFTHTAMYQAGIAVRDILGEEGPGADYRALPRVTFLDPEIGAVGLTEDGARHQGIHVVTGNAAVSTGSRGWIHGPGNDGFIKLVADVDRNVLVGATSAGPEGGEVLSALAVAVHAQVPLHMLREMIYAYPTFHRGINDALTDLAEHVP
jgi:pyruvate/2-oxoglutarate dehydrogenase complex dihydrolipoamide dehydrogenase (E3) component